MKDQIRIINILLMDHRQSLDDAYRRIHDAEVEVKIWKVVVSKLEIVVDKLKLAIEKDEAISKEQCEELNCL